MEMHDPSDVEQWLLRHHPDAAPLIDELERTVRYPDETDHVIELPISAYGGG